MMLSWTLFARTALLHGGAADAASLRWLLLDSVSLPVSHQLMLAFLLFPIPLLVSHNFVHYGQCGVILRSTGILVSFRRQMLTFIIKEG